MLVNLKKFDLMTSPDYYHIDNYFWISFCLLCDGAGKLVWTRPVDPVEDGDPVYHEKETEQIFLFVGFQHRRIRIVLQLGEVGHDEDDERDRQSEIPTKHFTAHHDGLTSWLDQPSSFKNDWYCRNILLWKVPRQIAQLSFQTKVVKK